MPNKHILSDIAPLLLLLSTASPAFAHGGHGDEFQTGGAISAADAVQVDADTAERLGIEITAVTLQQLTFGVEATGQLELLPNGQAEVTSPVEGTLTQVLVAPGETVEAGQPIAILFSPELAELYVSAQEQSIAAATEMQLAQAELQLAQQNYGQQRQIAAAERSRAEIDVKTARERYENDKALLSRGVIARQLVAESEIQLAAAESALTQASHSRSLLEASAELERAQANLQAAQSRLQLSGTVYEARLEQLGGNVTPDGILTLAAPIAGEVVELAVTSGEALSDAGQLLMAIANSDRLFATANIQEKDLARTFINQSVRVEVASLPGQIFPGRVASVGAVVDGATRVVPVRAEIDNADGSLKAGMFAELEILTEQTPAPVMVVPQSAVLEVDDRTLVFIENGSVFEPLDVTVGRTAGDWVEIESGLFEGDRVVSQRASQLYAQSLRGSSSGADDGQVGATETSGASMPWWGLGLAGGAIAASTFWAGTAWAGRRERDKTSATSAQTDKPLEVARKL
ncbi:efflux RND transporter periplasmic adaptor subunit [Synechococcus sp. PCC 7336]|uniref:efflux RND transporter periplasmic adaptor subunit n=1 Tax=Synechococcus sp. PCC 7336 TaxID=195250 RepID=UPI000346FC1C|nr:efflux RND transporter periplasmic adaptor subunit [Synechococcus sp. PCC 7336]